MYCNGSWKRSEDKTRCQAKEWICGCDRRARQTQASVHDPRRSILERKVLEMMDHTSDRENDVLYTQLW